MIRFSVNHDKEKLIELWRKVFGDSYEAINLFFDYHYDSHNTLVCELDGKIVSMLYLLEGDFVISNKSHPSYYLYAAATDPQHRGRGIMAQMLEFAKQTAAYREMDYICLLPAENSLYAFYEKFGYKTVFRKKIAEIRINGINVSQQSNCNDNDFAELRKVFLDDFDRFEWNNNDIEYAIRQHEFYGGKSILSCKGYCLYSVEDSKIVVKESTLQPDCVFNNNTSIIINLPVDFQIDCVNSEVADCGMALPLNEEAEAAVYNIKNAYLGLTLD